MNFEIISLSVKTNVNRKNERYKNYHKIYIFIDKETIFENLTERKYRNYKDYKTFVIPKLMEMLDFMFPLHYKSVMKDKWGWKQDCGCKCPCSPGFIGNIYSPFPLDIHVKIKLN